MRNFCFGLLIKRRRGGRCNKFTLPSSCLILFWPPEVFLLKRNVLKLGNCHCSVNWHCSVHIDLSLNDIVVSIKCFCFGLRRCPGAVFVCFALAWDKTKKCLVTALELVWEVPYSPLPPDTFPHIRHTSCWQAPGFAPPKGAPPTLRGYLIFKDLPPLTPTPHLTLY